MNILYEDKQIIVLVKEPGQLSEVAEGPESLLTLLKAHFEELGEHALPYPIHRLDRNVGGVMVYAKTKQSAAALSASVQRNELVKEYAAVVHGRPEAPEGTFEDLLWKDSRKNKTYVVTRSRKGVRDAKLDYRVLAEQPDRTLVRIHLHTGRSHQIRVQFASRKLPLIGDGKYGAKDNEELALFSCHLSFPHPKTGKVMEFEYLPEKLGGFELK